MSDVAENIVNSTAHDYNEEELEHAKMVELPVMIAKVDCTGMTDWLEQIEHVHKAEIESDAVRNVGVAKQCKSTLLTGP
jgi:hypothetical protein